MSISMLLLNPLVNDWFYSLKILLCHFSSWIESSPKLHRELQCIVTYIHPWSQSTQQSHKSLSNPERRKIQDALVTELGWLQTTLGSENRRYSSCTTNGTARMTATVKQKKTRLWMTPCLAISPSSSRSPISPGGPRIILCYLLLQEIYLIYINLNYRWNGKRSCTRFYFDIYT